MYQKRVNRHLLRETQNSRFVQSKTSRRTVKVLNLCELNFFSKKEAYVCVCARACARACARMCMCLCMFPAVPSDRTSHLAEKEGLSPGRRPLKLNDRKPSFRQTALQFFHHLTQTHTHTHAGKRKQGYAFVCVPGDGSLFAAHTLSPLCWVVSCKRDRGRNRDPCCIFMLN